MLERWACSGAKHICERRELRAHRKPSGAQRRPENAAAFGAYIVTGLAVTLTYTPASGGAFVIEADYGLKPDGE